MNTVPFITPHDNFFNHLLRGKGVVDAVGHFFSPIDEL